MISYRYHYRIILHFFCSARKFDLKKAETMIREVQFMFINITIHLTVLCLWKRALFEIKLISPWARVAEWEVASGVRSRSHPGHVATTGSHAQILARRHLRLWQTGPSDPLAALERLQFKRLDEVAWLVNICLLIRWAPENVFHTLVEWTIYIFMLFNTDVIIVIDLQIWWNAWKNRIFWSTTCGEWRN